MLRNDDNYYMERALHCALLAEAADEVPIGAVLVKSNQIIAEAWNQPIMRCDPTAHAEINVLRLAGEQLANYRLLDTTLYVTVEPCVMCFGALIHARIKRLVYGCVEPRMGAVNSALQLADANHFNHKLEITGGVLAAHSQQLIQTFFQRRR